MPVEPTAFTTAIHGGLSPDLVTGAIVTPLYQTTTFVQPAVGVDRGYTYSRSANPTVAALERNLAAIEDCDVPATCFASGMAALTALVLATCRGGDHVVCGQVVYGGTVRLLQQVFAPLGVRASFVDATDPQAVRNGLTDATRLVLVETPANPTLSLTDIAAVADVVRGRGAVLAVDNTFMTAVLQKPLWLGADVVVYSTTKFCEGHDSTIGGAVLTRDATLDARLRFVRNATGSGQAPLDAWLTLRGLKTLPLRMERHSASALQVARWLREQPAVARVHYPFLDGFPQAELSRRQQVAGGGVLAFELESAQAGIELLSRVELCSLAENLGAVETLITHPASMTHADVDPVARQASGLSDGLVRLSVGLEDPADLCTDLGQALSAVA